VIGPALALELVDTFLRANFSGAERHVRRLAKVQEVENKQM
jgi:ribose 5-phosphate isomerase B